MNTDKQKISILEIGKWYTYNGDPSSSTSSHKAGIDIMVVSQNQINNTSLVRVRPWGIKLSGSTFNLSQQTLILVKLLKLLTTLEKRQLMISFI